MTPATEIIPTSRGNLCTACGAPPSLRLLNLLALLLLAVAPSVRAACWPDAGLVGRANAVAARHFPTLVGRMPELVACHDADFPPQIGGDYTSGIHRIRIPSREAFGGSANLDNILAHELGHAMVAIEGQDAGPDGHGEAWVRTMLRAGLGAEVERMARFNPFTAAVLGRDLASRPPGGGAGQWVPALPPVLPAPGGPPPGAELWRGDRPPSLVCRMHWQSMRINQGGRIVEAGRWVPVCHLVGP